MTVHTVLHMLVYDYVSYMYMDVLHCTCMYVKFQLTHMYMTNLCVHTNIQVTFVSFLTL